MIRSFSLPACLHLDAQRPRPAIVAAPVKIFTLVLALALLAGCASIVRPNYTQAFDALRPGAYTLDQEHAYLLFRVEHLGLSTVVGRFNTVAASLEFNPAKPENLKLDGRVQTGSIDLGNTRLERQLRGRDWLDTEQFPEARFVTRTVMLGGNDTLSITGDFTLRGITQPVTLTATFNGGADNLLTGKYTLGFSATGSLSRAAFGVDAFAALVGDDIGIEIHAEFQRN